MTNKNKTLGAGRESEQEKASKRTGNTEQAYSSPQWEKI